MKFSFGGGGQPGGGGGGGGQRQNFGGGRPGGGQPGGGGGRPGGGGGGGGRKSTQVYEYSEDVQHLNAKKFNEKVRASEAMWLIQFYSSSGMQRGERG